MAAATADAEAVYVHSRYEKTVRDGRRRCHSWFLIDSLGAEHLAVVGVETDSLDGHYVYQALEPFASRMPLNCGNQGAVVKYLERWLLHKVGTAPAAAPVPAAAAPAAVPAAVAAAPPAPSAAAAEVEVPDFPTYSGGAVPSSSAATTTGAGSTGARRKAFTSSLCSSRAAVLQAAGTSPVNHYHYHQVPSSGAGRGKHKGKHGAGAGAYSTGAGGKNKAVGIVQQNQIKKARKVQDDIRAEHERVVAHHLARLRRAAAAELQGDNSAKQVALSWLQGELTPDELDVLEHWRSLLTTVLDLQQQQQQPGEGEGKGGADDGDDDGSSSNQQQQPPAPPQQQQQQQQQETEQLLVSPSKKQQQQQPKNGKSEAGGHTAGSNGDAAATPPATAAAGAGLAHEVPPNLLVWLQQPESRQHYVRVMLECLRELGSVEIPARMLLQHKLVGLVQRCRCEQQHEAVRSLAAVVLARWRWQLAGHMQGLSQPVYMQDHLAVLEEEVAAGLVPLPQLPKQKQAVLNTQLPTLPGGPGSRNTYYTPSPHSSYPQQHMASISGTPHMYYNAAAAAAAGFAAYPAGLQLTTAEGFSAAAAAGTCDASGFGGFSAAAAAAGFYTPMPAMGLGLLGQHVGVSYGQQAQLQSQGLTAADASIASAAAAEAAAAAAAVAGSGCGYESGPGATAVAAVPQAGLL